MRVLLTGATGFIGRVLVPLLQHDGHAAVAWVRSQVSARRGDVIRLRFRVAA